MIADGAVPSVVVCPQWSQHAHALPCRSPALVVAQHPLVESSRLSSVVPHSQRHVAVRIDLEIVEKYLRKGKKVCSYTTQYPVLPRLRVI